MPNVKNPTVIKRMNFLTMSQLLRELGHPRELHIRQEDWLLLEPFVTEAKVDGRGRPYLMVTGTRIYSIGTAFTEIIKISDRLTGDGDDNSDTRRLIREVDATGGHEDSAGCVEVHSEDFGEMP